eukprot:gnl/MRDRNA2_/MRDRNA2_91576_c0_seq1.p1 gnl/MRDRNA2_/MRDRNA2_91576_c0~~gnl/MRDRNA2_/MRDRNA2_91576_c0_seq1.p1  ORF type:complete len:218 (-),score=51.39 gnl/MRDRNA2_/MRDRNA2_91576_c0_seq1:6-659(-)
MRNVPMLILFLNEVAANILPLPTQSQVKGSNVGRAQDVAKSEMLRRFMVPPPRLAPAKAAEPNTEANTGEKEDDLMNRFMKNQKEARSARARAVSRIAKSALAATVSAAQAASAAAREVTGAIGGRQMPAPELIPIPVRLDENPESKLKRLMEGNSQNPNQYPQTHRYPGNMLNAQTIPCVGITATISLLVGSGITFTFFRFRRSLMMKHDKPLLGW